MLVVRFGPFEADLHAGELRKQGMKVRLQEKPFQVLALLLERPGDVVTREELRRQLWPGDTFVDFDHSLGTAVAKLRQALGDSAQSPRFVETVTSRGYRLIAPVSAAAPASDRSIVAAQPLVPASAGAAPPQRRLRWFVGIILAGLTAGALLVAVVLGFNVGGARAALARGTNPTVRSLAILPLENLSGDPAQEYFADGMTDELITRLARLENLRVISRTSVWQYRGAKKALPQIGRELNVDVVLLGSVIRSGERVRITAQLVDAATDQHLWAQSYERDVGDLLALQGEVSRAIAEEIRIRLTSAQQSYYARSTHVDPEVQEAYLRGRYHLNKGTEEEIRRGAAYFRQALAKDPRDARSYAGVADSYIALSDYYLPPSETYPQAKAAAVKALELDDSLAEAHISLGLVQFLYDWEWAKAENELQHAIRLNPGSVDAHVWYAVFLAQMGRPREAIDEIKRAEALDPLSLAVHVNAGWVFYLAREDEKARDEWRKALDVEPNFVPTHSSIWVAYRWGPEFGAVLKDPSSPSAPDGGRMNLAALAGMYATSGRETEARQVMSRLNALSGQQYVCPYEMATANAVLGNKDAALRALQQGLREHSGCMPDIKTDPRLDSLRSDPRFQELLRTVGFR